MAAPEIVDVHVHLCRDTAQEKLVWPRPGFPDEWRWGSPDKVVPFMDREGISHLCTLTYIDTHSMVEQRLSRLPEAQRAEARPALQQQVVEHNRRFNTWGCELGRKERRIIPFAAIDIGLFFGDETAMMEELEEKIRLGVRGVKMVPAFSGSFPADRRMFPLYDRLQEAGLPVLSDSGTGEGYGSYPGGSYGEPVNFVEVCRSFPSLKLILAHMPSAYWDQRLDIAREFPQVYFDTAGGFSSPQWPGRDGRRCCAIEDAPRLLRNIGTHRVLFGSDGPMVDLRPQLHQIVELPLSDEEKRRILSENARELLGLE
jgi:predicted TIM-barrel fold metal-dependent hydrolase